MYAFLLSLIFSLFHTAGLEIFFAKQSNENLALSRVNHNQQQNLHRSLEFEAGVSEIPADCASMLTLNFKPNIGLQQNFCNVDNSLILLRKLLTQMNHNIPPPYIAGNQV
jgi:replication initiation and membrane attachment protein DnaB